MKTKLPRLLPPAAVAAGLLMAAPALHAQTTYLFSEGGTGAPVTADNNVAFNINDTSIYKANSANNYGTAASNQSNLNDALGRGQGVQIYGFDGINFNDPSETIQSATLWLNLDFVFPTGGSGTIWNIVGLTSPWGENTATWDNLSGNILAGSTFGSFNDGGFSADDAYYGINVTSALQAFQSGSITGIAFVNSANGSTFFAPDQAIVFNSADNANTNLRPGLAVTTTPVPEPTGAALLAAVVGLLGFRRRRAGVSAR